MDSHLESAVLPVDLHRSVVEEDVCYPSFFSALKRLWLCERERQ